MAPMHPDDHVDRLFCCLSLLQSWQAFAPVPSEGNRCEERERHVFTIHWPLHGNSSMKSGSLSETLISRPSLSLICCTREQRERRNQITRHRTD